MVKVKSSKTQTQCDPLKMQKRKQEFKPTIWNKWMDAVDMMM
jgi:hypothetical protein